MGYISRPHGFHGAFVVQGHTGRESALGYAGKLWVGPTSQSAEEFEVSEAAWMPRGWKIKLRGWASDSVVKERCNQKVFVDRNILSTPEPNEFYLADLLDSEVIDALTGRTLGTCVGVESSHKDASRTHSDCWLLSLEDGIISVPAARRYIAQVDIEAKRIWVKNLAELK